MAWNQQSRHLIPKKEVKGKVKPKSEVKPPDEEKKDEKK